MRLVILAFMLTAMLGNPGSCGQLTEEEILGQAAARIEKYRKGDAALRLIDADGRPLPAYHALKRLIKSEWWTRAKATVAALGEVRFRGFFGKYNATVTLGERELRGEFWFDKNVPQPIRVSLN